MPRICHFTGKKTIAGHSAPRKGLPKKKGGAGQHIGVKSKRVFKVNLIPVKVVIEGKVQKVKVSAKYLKSGKINELLYTKAYSTYRKE